MKSKKIRVILILALVLYSLVGALLLVMGKAVLPIPFAEFAANSFIYFKQGIMINGGVGAFLYAAGIFFSVIMCFDGPRESLFPKLMACTLLIADIGIHAYAFLFSSGYQWNYLVSAVFDLALLVCVLVKDKNANDTEKNTENSYFSSVKERK